MSNTEMTPTPETPQNSDIGANNMLEKNSRLSNVNTVIETLFNRAKCIMYNNLHIINHKVFIVDGFGELATEDDYTLAFNGRSVEKVYKRNVNELEIDKEQGKNVTLLTTPRIFSSFIEGVIQIENLINSGNLVYLYDSFINETQIAYGQSDIWQFDYCSISRSHLLNEYNKINNTEINADSGTVDKSILMPSIFDLPPNPKNLHMTNTLMALSDVIREYPLGLMQVQLPAFYINKLNDVIYSDASLGDCRQVTVRTCRYKTFEEGINVIENYMKTGYVVYIYEGGTPVPYTGDPGYMYHFRFAAVKLEIPETISENEPV